MKLTVKFILEKAIHLKEIEGHTRLNFSLKLARLKRELQQVIETYTERERVFLEAHGTPDPARKGRFIFDTPEIKRRFLAEKESLQNEEVDILSDLITTQALTEENEILKAMGLPEITISQELAWVLLDLDDIIHAQTGEPHEKLEPA